MIYNLKDVTVGIKTFNRPEKLRAALRSLVNIPVREIIVADDGKKTKESQTLYREMSEKLPLTVLELPYDSGKPEGLNKIIDACNTKYLMLIDDDMQVLSSNHLQILKNILDAKKDFGGVASVLLENGGIKSGAHNLKIEGKYLVRYVPKGTKISLIDGNPIVIVDFLPFSAMFRLDVFSDVLWDEHHKIGYEHVDFYLSQKHLGKWKFALSLSSFIVHNPGGAMTYKQIRFDKERLKASKRYFLRKWNLKGIVVRNVEVLNRIYCRTASCLWIPIREHLPLKLLTLTTRIEENFGRIIRILK